MAREPYTETWLHLEDILERQDAAELQAFLDTLSPGEVARALSRMDDDDQRELLTRLEPENAANLLEELSDIQAAAILEDLPVDVAASIVDEMESDERVDVLAELDEEDAEAILGRMDPEEAQDARQLLVYDANTAGGIMITEYLAFYKDRTIGDILQELHSHAEEYADYGVQYIYVIDRKRKLIGVIRLRDLVLSPPGTPLINIMLTNLVTVNVDTSLDELEQLFDRHGFIGVPVLDQHSRLVGLVQREDVEEAHGERAERDFLRLSGIIGGEEFRTMPFASRTIKRLAFLTPNIALNFIAASVIGFFTETLRAVIVLAVFLPIISDMSGNSGSQSIAVSIRELSLGLVKPRDFMLVLLKELYVGIVNGIVLGIVLGIIAGLYVHWWGDLPGMQGAVFFGGVIAVAMALNTVIGGVLGGLLPLGLKSANIDPAMAAGPILTTVTDMSGFFLVLGLAYLAMPLLVGV